LLFVDSAHLPSSKLDGPESRVNLDRSSKVANWDPSVVLPVNGLPVQNYCQILSEKEVPMSSFQVLVYYREGVYLALHGRFQCNLL
jgi:hypothetical protein